MPSATCPHCGAVQSAPETSADRQPTIRCSQCGESYAPAGDSAEWSMKTPEGQIYGPVSQQQIDHWIAEGRITSECWLRSDPRQPWLRAELFYPVLRPAVSATTALPSPAAKSPVGSGEFLPPHRAGTILFLGIASWLFWPMLSASAAFFLPRLQHEILAAGGTLWLGFPLFGMAAWLMGSSDLHQMKHRHIDPSGAGVTRVGGILGQVQVLLSAFLYVMAGLLAVLAVLVNPGG